MKYMGSKRWMLENGLGTLLRREIRKHERFVDLFCGAASVSWFIATLSDVPVLAVDLQRYATTLADAVLLRDEKTDSEVLIGEFVATARRMAAVHPLWADALRVESSVSRIRRWSKSSIEVCKSKPEGAGEVWRSYGGYYFSPQQAIVFDALLSSLPRERAQRAICLASVIIAASQCAASPGHTAQPFAPNPTAGRFLHEAWKRDVLTYVTRALTTLSTTVARVKGRSRVGDALAVAKTLRERDLVFIDPPYSGVHYSRFYHVLETIARGACGAVSGTGRYPPPAERPASAFSRKGESAEALSKLLVLLGRSGCTAVVTFPTGECSNGLSGGMLIDMARATHRICERRVKARFSTLGGNNRHRRARHASEELVLLLRPR